MKVRQRNNTLDGCTWVCRNKKVVDGGKRKDCNAELSFRYGTWFSGSSKLTIKEIFFLLTFEIIIGRNTGKTFDQYKFGSHPMADWPFINEQVLEFIEEKIGGFGKIVEIGESKFGKRK